MVDLARRRGDKRRGGRIMVRLRREAIAVVGLLLIAMHAIGLRNAVPHLRAARFGRDDDGASATTTTTGPPRPRVAVIVAGTLRRFLVTSTVARLVRPMAEADRVDVDVYVHLTTAHAAAYRSGGYMDRAVPDPALPVAGLSANETAENIESVLGNAGAHAVAVTIEESVDLDGDAALGARRREATAAHPDEDPDLRFPIIDVRSDEVQRRTANANRNLLRLHHSVRDLWREALRREEEGGASYDAVLFLRDDSYWLADFSIRPFLDGGDRDVFIPICDARVPPMAPSEVCDHIVISRRGAAPTFGEYYSGLFDVDLDECQRNCGLNDPRRGCNSEMLLKHVMDRANLNVTGVPQSVVPFQRSVVVQREDGSTTVCFHKFCQSKERPLDLEGVDIPRCKDLQL